MFIAVALAALTMTAPPGDAPVTPPEEPTPSTTQSANPFVPVGLPDAYLNPTPDLCSAYQTFRGLVNTPGPEGAEMVDAWFILAAEESANVPNGRLTDEQRDQIRAVLAGCVAPPAATPTTAAGTIDPNAALLRQHLQGLNVTLTEEQADCMLDIAGGDMEIVIADVGVMSDIGAQCGVDLTTVTG